MTTDAIVALAGLVGFWVLNALFASRQRAQVGGSLLRVVWVSGVVALLAAAPALAGLAFRSLSAGAAGGPEVSWVASFVVFVFGSLWLRPTSVGRGLRVDLPSVDDPALAARVAQIAAALGQPVPPVRLLPSTSGELAATASMAGLAAPALVVTDGILHRLSAEERDGVVAHELAHRQGGRMWTPLILFAVASTAAVLLRAHTTSGAGTAGVVWSAIWGFALFIGLRRAVGRREELRCDRAAAQVVGFSVMARALEKIHAAHDLPNRGWLAALVCATATHPSRAARLAALSATTPWGASTRPPSSSRRPAGTRRAKR